MKPEKRFPGYKSRRDFRHTHELDRQAAIAEELRIKRTKAKESIEYLRSAFPKLQEQYQNRQVAVELSRGRLARIIGLNEEVTGGWVLTVFRSGRNGSEWYPEDNSRHALLLLEDGRLTTAKEEIRCGTAVYSVSCSQAESMTHLDEMAAREYVHAGFPTAVGMYLEDPASVRSLMEYTYFMSSEL